MKRVYFLICLVAALLGSTRSNAYPDVERLPSSGDAPLSFSTLDNNPTLLIMPLDTSTLRDRFLITASGADILIVDTETWELYSSQPSALDANIKGLAILPGTDTLIASLADGTLAQMSLTDVTATPTTYDISTTVSSAELGPMVASQTTGDNHLYILDINNKKLWIFNRDDLNIGSVALRDITGITYTPTDIAYVHRSDGDKVYISTSSNAVIIVPVSTGVATVLKPDTATHNFVAVTATPDNSAVLVVDRTTNAVWVIDTATDTFADQSTTSSGTNPITMVASGDAIENSSLADIVASDVLDPTAVYAYIGGDRGLSVADITEATTAVAGSKLIDLNSSSTQLANDPIALSQHSVQLAASSAADGYVYSGNTNNTISVVSDNPFVTIASNSVSGSLTTVSPTFALTFQSDEVGTYRVVLNSNIRGTAGEELIGSTSISTANTNVTTATIDTTGNSNFREGTNRVFVFVTDADGNVGRDAIDVTLDLPPETVSISGIGFGNGKLHITFSSLGVGDISQYLFLAKETTAASCPDTIDFSQLTADTADGSTTVPGATCTATSTGCEATISGLTNGATYCVGARAVDNSNQTSATTAAFATPVSPEVTLSLTDVTGQTGCALNPDMAPMPKRTAMFFIFLFASLIPFLQRGKLYKLLFLAISFSLFMTRASAHAEEWTPKHWSVAFKPGFFLSNDSNFNTFFGDCCNVFYTMEVGYIFNSRYEVGMSAGFFRRTGEAIGATSGQTSADKFTVNLVPLATNFTYRAEFTDTQPVVPYAGVGFDYVYAYQGFQGGNTQFWKFGMHGNTGIQINLGRLSGDADLDTDFGINGFYLLMEAKYSQLNNFGGEGLDLSGWTYSTGFLVQF